MFTGAMGEPFSNLLRADNDGKPGDLSAVVFPPGLRALVLAPHPDDFECIAATMRHLSAAGVAIELAVLTGAAGGVEDGFCRSPTADNKERLREAEQRDGCRLFGLPDENLRFLHLEEDDEGHPCESQNNVAAVRRCLDEVDPDLVFLPHPADTNAGHRRVYRMFVSVAGSASASLAAFLNEDPKTIEMQATAFFAFDEETAAWKAELLRCHRSQHERNLRTRGVGLDERILGVNRKAAEQLKIEAPYAEAFDTERWNDGRRAMAGEPNEEMRREAMFSGERPYDILVASDVLQHGEAAIRVAAHLASIVESHSSPEPIKILDLACGRDPVITAAAVREHPGQRFAYIGVDINPQQIDLAHGVMFPGNVIAAELIEGSAWDLSHLAGRGPFDIVFVGLNWHHGTPEEIWFLAQQVRELLAPGGCLINHDCYRPESELYLRRPRMAVEHGQEVSLDQVPGEALASAAVPDFGFVETVDGNDAPEWKSDLIDRLERAYREGGGSDAGAGILCDHSWVRDFPVSVTEVRTVLEAAGFAVEVERYAPDASLAPYLALLVARPR